MFNDRVLYGQPCRAVGLADPHAGLGDRVGDLDDLFGDPAGLGEYPADLVQSVPGSLLIEHLAGDPDGLPGDPAGLGECPVGRPEGLCGLRGCRGDLPVPLLPLHRRSGLRQAVVLPRE